VILIPQYGLLGAAIASCLSFLLYNLSRYIFILVKFKMQPYDMSFLKVLGAGAIGFGVAFLVPSMSNAYADTVARSAAFMIIYLPLIYRMHVSPDLNLTLKTYMKKLLRQ
jgi:O-antigen/teichoic acid export membrane protein